MNEEIGKVAGSVWHILEAKGEMTLTKLKKEVGATGPVVDWAIGWLAREDKIDVTLEKRTARVCLKGWHSQAANAA
jgi:Winged helix-turn-helix domain (DUF2582)